MLLFVGHDQAGRATVAVQTANETYKEWNGTSYHPAHDRRSVGSQNGPPKVSHSKFGQAGQHAAVNKPPLRKLAQPRSAPRAERVEGLISVWRDEIALGKGKKKPHFHLQSPPRKIVHPPVQQKKPNEAVMKGPVSGGRLSPPRKIVRPQVQQKKSNEAVKKRPVFGGSLVVKDGKRMSSASQSPRGYVSVELSRGKGYAYVRHIKPGFDTRQQIAERTSSDRHFNLESSSRKQSGSWRLFHPHRAQRQGKFRPFKRLSGDHPQNEYLSSTTFGGTTVLSELNSTSVPLSPGDSSTISTAHLPTEGQIVGS